MPHVLPHIYSSVGQSGPSFIIMFGFVTFARSDNFRSSQPFLKIGVGSGWFEIELGVGFGTEVKKYER